MTTYGGLQAQVLALCLRYVPDLLPLLHPQHPVHVSLERPKGAAVATSSKRNENTYLTYFKAYFSSVHFRVHLMRANKICVFSKKRRRLGLVREIIAWPVFFDTDTVQVRVLYSTVRITPLLRLDNNNSDLIQQNPIPHQDATNAALFLRQFRHGIILSSTFGTKLHIPLLGFGPVRPGRGLVRR